MLRFASFLVHCGLVSRQQIRMTRARRIILFWVWYGWIPCSALSISIAWDTLIDCIGIGQKSMPVFGTERRTVNHHAFFRGFLWRMWKGLRLILWALGCFCLAVNAPSRTSIDPDWCIFWILCHIRGDIWPGVRLRKLGIGLDCTRLFFLMQAIVEHKYTETA